MTEEELKILKEKYD